MSKLLGKCITLEGAWQPSAIIFCPSEKAWKKAMKHQLNGNNDEYPVKHGSRLGAVRWYENHTTGHSVILIAIGNHNRNPAELISTLIHESVHVFQFVCKAMGEQQPGIEFEAYGIQYIYDWLIDSYTKTIGKGVKWDTGRSKRRKRK